MIAQATPTSTAEIPPASTTRKATDRRSSAKARMRAAAAPRAKTPAPATSALAQFDHKTVIEFVKKHPIATAATVGAATSLIGPIRLVRLGMGAFRTVSLAAGVVTFLGSLGVKEAEEVVESAMPHSKPRARRKGTSAPRKSRARAKKAT